MMSPGERKNEDPMKSVIPGGTDLYMRGRGCRGWVEEKDCGV